LRRVKFLVAELLGIVSQKHLQKNVRLLMRYLLVVLASVAIYSVLFHVLMQREGRDFSWLTGVYWTLTVMTTLGFGDITFHGDVGRAFTIVVLITGLFLMLIVLPFAFIRHFYSPWLEAQMRVKAPRAVPDTLGDHVVFGRIDDLTTAVIQRLELLDIPYAALEPDPGRALIALDDGLRVVLGDPAARSTYEALRIDRARLLIANLGDHANTNATLTAREVSQRVPILAFAEDKDSIDILRLSGAQHVLAIKHRLGEYLAARVTLGAVHAEVVASYHDLLIAEVAVHGTRFVGKTVAGSELHQITGLSIIACWERGRLLPARPDLLLTDHSVAVIAGTQSQIEGLNAALDRENGGAPSSQPPQEQQAVILIGGGKVGRAAARALRKRNIGVHIIDEDRALEPVLSELADRVFIGDAADNKVITAAGIADAPSVLISSHDDAFNIYLTVYCRKLNPDCRIISRIVSDTNLEAMYRAGADFVLGESALGVKFVMSVLHGRDIIVLGEDVDVFLVKVPRALAGRTLEQSEIGTKTGLTVIAIQVGTTIDKTPPPGTVMPDGASLVMLGTQVQRKAFLQLFDADDTLD
jgi:voltage-gated potassium channel